jgi:tetratricopeptide (TPR) repeat protein
VHELDERRFSTAIDSFSKVLALKPNFAVAHAKIGTAYAALGKNALAVKHLQAVTEHDPNDPSGAMMLGWLAYLDGKGDDAVEAYRRADDIEPFNSRTHYHWALALAKLGRLPDATIQFREVLAIDPNHAGACHGLSTALRQQGQAEEAVRFAKRAARLTKEQDPDVLLELAEAYASTGRLALAVAAAGKAMEMAQATNPNTAPQIRWRLEEWRSRAKKAAG